MARNASTWWFFSKTRGMNDCIYVENSRITIVRGSTPACHASHVCERECSICAQSSKGVRGISVRRICVAVRDHSCRHASWSNETHRKLRYIKFNNRWPRNLFSSIFTERNFGFYTKNSWIYQSPTNLFYLFLFS